MRGDSKHSAKLIASLSIVYIVWGSSFLFSKIGVSHLPPALFSGVRFIMAGASLVLLAHFWRGDPFPKGWNEWRDATVMGVFTVLLSNGLNVWSIKYISSSESALLNTTAALWIIALGSFGKRGHPLTRQAVLGLALGSLGTLLTLSPTLGEHTSSAWPYLGALLAALSWSFGTIYYRYVDTRLSVLMFIGAQMLTGGLLQFAVGCELGQLSQWSFNVPGMVALGYLSIFSSGFAYTAYGWLTRNTSPAVIGTYNYVNPVIAAFLGWLFLHEQLLPTQLAGLLVSILGVALVTLRRSVPDAKSLEEPASP